MKISQEEGVIEEVVLEEAEVAEEVEVKEEVIEPRRSKKKSNKNDIIYIFNRKYIVIIKIEILDESLILFYNF